MSLRFTCIVSAAVAGCLAMGQAARAETYYVRAVGNDQGDGKTPQTAFRSVLRAAQVLTHGDHVVIGPGSYAGTAFFAGVALAARNAAQRFWLASAMRFLPAGLSLRFLPAGLAGAAFSADTGAFSSFR